MVENTEDIEMINDILSDFKKEIHKLKSENSKLYADIYELNRELNNTTRNKHEIVRLSDNTSPLDHIVYNNQVLDKSESLEFVHSNSIYENQVVTAILKTKDKVFRYSVAACELVQLSPNNQEDIIEVMFNEMKSNFLHILKK